MNYDLNKARLDVAYLDNLRFERTLSGSSAEFQQVFQLITLLLHINHPALPAILKKAPQGIADFNLSPYQKNYLTSKLSTAELVPLQREINDKSDRTSAAIWGVYVMGSVASVSQTSMSDLDIWVCQREGLCREARELLKQKQTVLQQWAMVLGIDINLYLIDQKRFRSFRYADPLTAENCGSAQYMLLLDEFYRTAIRLAGKPLLWLHLAVEDEHLYETEVARLIDEKQLDPNDWVDFGGLGAFSANEYFGASLWQLYKGIDAPYKSALKILLLEMYSSEYPHTHLIAQEFKQRLLKGERDYHFDAYLTMLERVTRYLINGKEFKRLAFARLCFYIKATDYGEYRPQSTQSNWRLDYLQKLVKEWGWSEKLIEDLNQRSRWKIKQVKENHDDLIQFLMFSYRHLVYFARKYKVNSSIMPQDLSILTRKLYTAFEELPGKITLLNSTISANLSEQSLTFIEVKNNRFFKDGWYLVNQVPAIESFATPRNVEYAESLNKLVAWAYFNRVLTPATQLYISSKNVSLDTLRKFVTDLRLSFPNSLTSASNEELSHSCEIRDLVVTVNLSVDPTKNLLQAKSNIVPSDLFSFGPAEESLVGSIDLTYRNVWNEIRTLHFEGANAILLALKVLSNKVSRGSTPPRVVNVFCYSQHYRMTLRNIVTALINKCLSIQIGTSDVPQNNTLRVAGKNWQFFFEERGLSLQELHSVQPRDKQEFDIALQGTIEEHEAIALANEKHYPYEIDAFASEGFLQFFFEDNPNKSFNVYILDEANHIEIYRHCEGSKEQKIREINHIYQSAGLEGCGNPYKIVQRNFNYPQFYQLLPEGNGVKIVPFYSRLALS